MHFHKLLLKIRKEQSYTQQSLVDTVGIQVTHIKEEDQLLQFEAISRFTPEKKIIAKAVLECLILKHYYSRFFATG